MDILRQAGVMQHAERRAQNLRAVFLNQVFKGLFRHFRCYFLEEPFRARARLPAA